jgi:type I restriction enzyme S subunit
VNNHAHVLRVREKNGLYTEYVFYILQHKNVIPFIKGSTRTKLNQSELRKIPVPVPPLVEQRGIAEVLGTVDEAIRLTDQVIERTEMLKRGLMQRLLTQGIGHTEFKDTPLGKIPKGWNILPLNKIVHSMRNGINYSKDDFGSGTKFVNVSDIFIQDYIDNNKLDRIKITPKEINNYALKNGDIVLVRSSLKKEGVAYPALFQEDNEPVVFCGFLIRLRPKKDIVDPYFLLQYLRMEQTRNWLISGSGTVAITNVSQGSLNPLQVIVPSMNEQKQIVRLCKEMNNKLELEYNTINKFKLTKQGLMQVLLSGKVRVELREDGIHRVGDSREANN